MKVFKMWVVENGVVDINDIDLFMTRERAHQAALEYMSEVGMEFKGTQNTATEICYYNEVDDIGVYICEETVHP